MFAGFHRHEKEGPMRKLLTFPCVTKVLALSLFVVVTGAAAAAHAQDVSVYAVGLDAPRGMTFGPDGNLYVAEAGRGGPNTPCVVVPIVGPYHGGPTARVSMISSSGERVTVVDGLPSGMTSLPSGDTIGAAAVAFLGSKLSF
jgi:glucose/arabinose dehydrogenase